jgi:hypothetical protein
MAYAAVTTGPNPPAVTFGGEGIAFPVVANDEVLAAMPTSTDV